MTTISLLPLHKSILSATHSPETSDLLLLARGLGLRRIVCTLIQIYESPQNLVILVNATPSEEAGIGDELNIMGCRKPGLRLVTYEMSSKDRQNLYRGGGLLSVTSRILVVDMLQGDIPINLISGLVVLHAEKVTPQSTEAFIIRLYREKNQEGFLKAFSDQPEYMTAGMSPLKDVMKELQVRNVHIFPRFHEDVKQSLERRRADVVQIAAPMTEMMRDIHVAIIQCIEAVLSDLKRSNGDLNLDDLNVHSAYFQNFDMVVRRQLNPVWHRVGPRTKQLVGDLSTLRQLLQYLLSYDALAFQAYIESIIASNSTNAAGNPKHNRSAWLSSDPAHIIFQSARRRCFVSSKVKRPQPSVEEEAWDVLDEVQETSGESLRPKWLPSNITPVLEELPKWDLLAETLLEIEGYITNNPIASNRPGTDVVLVMCNSERTATFIRDYLSVMDKSASRGQKGRKIMEHRLRSYLFWKGRLSDLGGKSQREIGQVVSAPETPVTDGQPSEALRRKDALRKERQGSRRRVRGGPPGGPPSERTQEPEARAGAMGGENVVQHEAEQLAEFFSMQARPADQLDEQAAPYHLEEFNEYYGLVQPEQLVIVRSYGDDTDDQVLAEIRPRFIIMYEPNLDFVRRIEVYRGSTPGLSIRVYVMMWDTSAEEDKYLAEVRREKESFEKLIKERASMVLVLQEKPSPAQDRTEAMIRNISSRNAGGRITVVDPPSVVVDVREFRSSLPGLLHASKILVQPKTLTVGDYVLSPDIVVERKSIPDLISSFNSGRLYTQCELMSAHYKIPLLLIEFEQDKSFALQTLMDTKSKAKPTGKYPVKGKAAQTGADSDTIEHTSIQSKLVLLTLAFPRLRIVWSSSPYATVEVFADLKKDSPQPDPERAVLVGAEEGDAEASGVNAAAEELLRALPGINAKNVRHVMNSVGSIRELCELDLAAVQAILGGEPGKACYEFIHHRLANK